MNTDDIQFLEEEKGDTAKNKCSISFGILS